MVVFITGASSGIGAATARAFALSGAHLVLAARRIERLHAPAAELTVPAHLIPLDVRDRGAVHAAVTAIPAAFAAIDVNNAGLSRGFEPLHEGSEDDWARWSTPTSRGCCTSRALCCAAWWPAAAATSSTSVRSPDTKPTRAATSTAPARPL